MAVYPRSKGQINCNEEFPATQDQHTGLGFSVERNNTLTLLVPPMYPPTLRALFLAVKYLINTFLSFFACAVKPAAFLFFSSFLIFFSFPLSFSLRFRFSELFSTTMLASSTSEERSNFARYSS